MRNYNGVCVCVCFKKTLTTVCEFQGVKKAARGNYSCRVGNGVPNHDFEVQSDPIFLDVKCE